MPHDFETQTSVIALHILKFLNTQLWDLKPEAIILLVAQIVYTYEKNSLKLSSTEYDFHLYHSSLWFSIYQFMDSSMFNSYFLCEMNYQFQV